jgi:feruloyl esterase
MRILTTGVSVALAVLSAGSLSLHAARSATRPCESLSALSLPGVTITSAQASPTGSFALPQGQATAAQQQVLAKLPAVCRVAATLRPSADSDIKVEIWMPASGWNGKLESVGNGGWSGSIPYPAMLAALGRGYATASTDTGHTGSTAGFAVGHPEKLVDFGYRSVHEMTLTARQVLSAFYDEGPKRSYWNGCSAGGRQGLKEAQQFPGDYDGIVAGAPALDWTGRAAQSMRVGQAVHDEAGHLGREEFSLIHDAVLAQCDADDGVKDGVIENPRRCRFDPGSLVCKGSDTTRCLTPAQVNTARLIYSAAPNPKTGRDITALEPGSELGWTTWGGPQPFAIGLDHFRDVVFKDPSWDSRQFNFDRDIVKAEEVDAGTINALDPNLKPFFDRGGRLIQYHGWSDPQISPGNSVQYYERVLQGPAGTAAKNSYRLFMVPGMAHCSGGEGPSTFDALSALEQWVEHGTAPGQLVASLVRDGKVVRTRPLCPYPEVAVYSGTGSTDDAGSFSCKAR